MTRDPFSQHSVVVSVTLLESGYIEQQLIDANGRSFVLILQPVDATLAQVSVLLRQGLDHDVFSNSVGMAVLNITLSDGAESIRYAVPVGSPSGE